MTRIISNKGEFSGGYFVMNERTVEAAFTGTPDFPVSCKTEKGLLNCILRLIGEADDYIKICSFIIDNEEVAKALLTKLKDRKLSVFILTAIDEKKIKSDMLEENENAELSKSRHFEFIDALVREGAHIRASSNAHAKFVIRDGVEGLIMSANLTEPSLNGNNKGKIPNDESGIIIAQSDDVNALEKIYDSIFLYGTEFRRFISLSDNTQLIGKNENELLRSDFPEKATSILWSYDSFHHSIYEKLNSIISKAERTINISTYSIVELNKLPELIESIRDFRNRKNGMIKIFCRAMNHRPDHVKACKLLSELGVEIFGDMFNHSKGIVADKNEGIIFTANIDGKHGLKSGFEVGCYLDSSHKSFSSFDSFLDYQIQTAPYVFKITPEKTEVFDFYRNWYREKEISVPAIFPSEFEIKYRSNADYARDFEEAVSTCPVFFTPLNGPERKKIQLKTNNKAYLLEALNESTFALKQQLKFRDIMNAQEYMLFYNQINLTSYES